MRCAPGPRGLLVASLAFAALPVSGCSGGKPASGSPTTTVAGTEGAAKIVLRGARLNSGPFTRHLSLRLGTGGQPIPFYVCAVRSRVAPKTPCRAVPGGALPVRASLRLEQHPVGPGIKQADSPGWGLVGTSDQPVLQVVLSDFVSGAKPRTVTYRVTLRTASGRLLATSNTLTIAWHR